MPDPDFLRHLRGRGPVFRLDPGRLVVADADHARQVNADNFADLTLPDRFVDLVRGRSSPPVSWARVRSAWFAALRDLSGPAGTAALAGRMDAVLARRAGQPVDLVWLSHEVMFSALQPLVIDGLPLRDRARVAGDAILKLRRLMGEDPGPRRSVPAQLRAGLAVRRELRGRASGRRPPRADLTQPVVDLLGPLGPDRAVDAVTAVLTAIAGPPGAVASCVLYELVTRADWSARVAAELAAVDPGELHRRGVRAAPVTHRFVREVLRRWSAPLLMTRSVRTPLSVGGETLDVGQQYLVSPYLVHHDGRHWTDPEVFDPDRWLPGAVHGPPGGQHTVPFGWAPTSCVGAGIGTLQLVLLCHLVSTRYAVEPAHPDRVRVALAAVPLPMDFTGVVRRRPDPRAPTARR